MSPISSKTADEIAFVGTQFSPTEPTASYYFKLDIDQDSSFNHQYPLRHVAASFTSWSIDELIWYPIDEAFLSRFPTIEQLQAAWVSSQVPFSVQPYHSSPAESTQTSSYGAPCDWAQYEYFFWEGAWYPAGYLPTGSAAFNTP